MQVTELNRLSVLSRKEIAAEMRKLLGYEKSQDERPFEYIEGEFTTKVPGVPGKVRVKFHTER